MVEDGIRTPSVDAILGDSSAESLLLAYGLMNVSTAHKIIKRMEQRDHQGLSRIFPYFLTILGSSPNPERSLVNFERFQENFGPGLFVSLAANPRLIELLVTIFSSSPFLTEILLRTPSALELLNDRQLLTERKTIEQFQNGAFSGISMIPQVESNLDIIRRFQRRELLRIGVCDFLGLFDLGTVLSQLSRMAVGIVRACLSIAVRETGISSEGIVVFAMGKLGGWELNYSSDIDLVFAAKQNPEKYARLVNTLIQYIANSTSEGFLYRTDLRLRPWGNDGPLIASETGYLRYIQTSARLWEKQAFLKARSIAGNLSFGENLRKKIEPFLFLALSNEVRASIFAMKRQTEELLKERGRRWGEIKLGEGSIRDIEFVVQSLQLIHPTVRTRSTLKAIVRLRETGMICESESHVLSDGYKFLRTIEHYLQMIDYRQTDTIPSDKVAVNLLARRFGFDGPKAGEMFLERYEKHCLAIRSIFLKYVGSGLDKLELDNDEGQRNKEINKEVEDHVAKMDPSYTTAFSQKEIDQHARLASMINDENLAVVDIKELGENKTRVTIVGFDYLGELSLICGLLFVYGMDILDSQIFTYEPKKIASRSAIPSTTIQEQSGFQNETILYDYSVARNPANKNEHRKIVDVFTVRMVGTEYPSPEMWAKYSDELLGLLKKMQAGLRREARGILVKRVARVFQDQIGANTPLYPIDIIFNNESSPKYTIMKIETQDTVGFLYEFSNALAINRINIVRMNVLSIGNRVSDTLYITDEAGNKIISEEKKRELRAATVLIKHFTHLLPHSPDPEVALIHFRELIGQLFDRPNWPDDLAKMDQSVVLNALAKLLGVSKFLWEDFLRMQYANLFPVISDLNALSTSKSFNQLQIELDSEISVSQDWQKSLNEYKDREMFRIDMRHILGYTTEFWDFSDELTNLVEVVISTIYDHCKREMQKLYGVPILENRERCPSTIFALGKCGGRELGFASDIELMFIYRGKGKTTGPMVLSASEFHEELVRNFNKSIQARQEGIFHIDLQLRPYGKAGSLAVSQAAFQKYYAPMGPAWAYERQALVKLRTICGDAVLGADICSLRDQFVYRDGAFDITAMRAMRERQIRHLVTAEIFNAKYSPGGLVDVEYLVQGLQIFYGIKDPSLRLTNIRMAMAALAKAGNLPIDDYARLRKAHTFLRWLIDSLRVVRGNSQDVNIPPLDSEEFAFLARRLRYGSNLEKLREDLSRYPQDVQEINNRLLSPPI